MTWWPRSGSALGCQVARRGFSFRRPDDVQRGRHGCRLPLPRRGRGPTGAQLRDPRLQANDVLGEVVARGLADPPRGLVRRLPERVQTPRSCGFGQRSRAPGDFPWLTAMPSRQGRVERFHVDVVACVATPPTAARLGPVPPPATSPDAQPDSRTLAVRVPANSRGSRHSVGVERSDELDEARYQPTRLRLRVSAADGWSMRAAEGRSISFCHRWAIDCCRLPVAVAERPPKSRKAARVAPHVPVPPPSGVPIQRDAGQAINVCRQIDDEPRGQVGTAAKSSVGRIEVDRARDVLCLERPAVESHDQLRGRRRGRASPSALIRAIVRMSSAPMCGVRVER